MRTHILKPQPGFGAHFLKNISPSTILEPISKDDGQTCTKVIASLGPACNSIEVLSQMLEAGAVAMRIELNENLPIETYKGYLRNLQAAATRVKRLCAVVVVATGRDVTARGYDTPQNFTAGQSLTLVSDAPEGAVSTSDMLVVHYPGFSSYISAGDTFSVGDFKHFEKYGSALQLQVEEVRGSQVICSVLCDADLGVDVTLFSFKSADDELALVQSEMPVLSAYDKQMIEELSESYEIDFLSLTNTISADDINTAREFLKSVGLQHTKVLARIESLRAINHFNELAYAADGIVIARGMLGLDAPPEKIALIQKNLIRLCNFAGKPAIVTRVFDSMVENPRPTRAEATDVANAVLDGCDALVLGAETRNGANPIAAVRTIVGICREAEKVFDHKEHFDFMRDTAVKQAAKVAVMFEEDSTGGSPEDISRTTSFSHFPSRDSDQNLHGAFSSLHARKPMGQHTSADNLRHHTQFKFQDIDTISEDMGPSHSMSNLSKCGGGVAAAHGMHPIGGSMTSVTSYACLTGPSMQKQHQCLPLLSKLDAIASAAVKVAEKCKAGLIVVYTTSSTTANLVAKYRPPVPILTLVSPQLASDGVHWRLVGRMIARQCLLTRGIIPMLAETSLSGSKMLENAITRAAAMGLVTPSANLVCIQRVHEEITLKVMTTDDMELQKPHTNMSPQRSQRLSINGATSSPTIPPQQSSKPPGTREVVSQRPVGVFSIRATSGSVDFPSA